MSQSAEPRGQPLHKAYRSGDVRLAESKKLAAFLRRSPPYAVGRPPERATRKQCLCSKSIESLFQGKEGKEWLAALVYSCRVILRASSGRQFPTLSLFF